MKHPKTYHKQIIHKHNQSIIIEGPLSSAELAKYYFDRGLKAFRPAEKQYDAICSIADFEEGRIIVARDGDKIVGYATFLHPDPLERWSTYKMEDLMELGAIEVSHDYRGLRVGSTILEVAMMDKQMEKYIIITTEYYWHWDMKSTGLNVWEYRKLMEKMMGYGGLVPMSTDDPEIISHPANCLLVRIGREVPQSSIDQFNQLRFMGRKDFFL
ncbi:GNAT family N-acetyltransferase [Tenuibacillus multivorans]|uniref:Acetoin utilization protein AcuA n=1 Tax=Tenuibacillus multivorans TaxID=237069 RepID=A0A1H0EFR0_9BACI|nr:GNAT family N-acetyltransferase [Tenuibacillus multivorans]GEL77177.1 acetoin utilization protein AcuA [Tenuibacillus multivorans]SDN81193.1 acetoin utilization protein AcuA [Tenuibacillus multivorans]